MFQKQIEKMKNEVELNYQSFLEDTNKHLYQSAIDFVAEKMRPVCIIKGAIAVVLMILLGGTVDYIVYKEIDAIYGFTVVGIFMGLGCFLMFMSLPDYYASKIRNPYDPEDNIYTKNKKKV